MFLNLLKRLHFQTMNFTFKWSAIKTNFLFYYVYVHTVAHANFKHKEWFIRSFVRSFACSFVRSLKLVATQSTIPLFQCQFNSIKSLYIFDVSVVIVFHFIDFRKLVAKIVTLVQQNCIAKDKIKNLSKQIHTEVISMNM